MRFVTGENEGGRRLDRVLKKYLKNAPLAFIYRIIRKDVKVNGRRTAAETILAKGDVVEIFLPDEQIETLSQANPSSVSVARKQFKVIFEDSNILVADKPFGLLTHGDKLEKKNTLTNQVIAYLAGTETNKDTTNLAAVELNEDTIDFAGAETNKDTMNLAAIKLYEDTVYPAEADTNKNRFSPETITFYPAPVNRLDRNTTGLVVFGKTLPATQDLAMMFRGSEDGNPDIEKVYLTIVRGEVKKELTLRAKMVRDGDSNVTRILNDESKNGRGIVTKIVPLRAVKGYTLIEAKLLTGRTHQIRAQLADAGFPVIGDRKYGDRRDNNHISGRYGLTTQLLHAYRLTIISGRGRLEYLTGKTFKAKPPARFIEILEDLGCDTNLKL